MNIFYQISAIDDTSPLLAPVVESDGSGKMSNNPLILSMKGGAG